MWYNISIIKTTAGEKEADVKISQAKLKAIMIYFAENTNYLGKIKLMKLFYYLDFTHIKQYGSPITWDQYFHLEKGPIPSTVMNMVGELVQDPEGSGLSDSIKIVTPTGTSRMLKVKGLRKFNENDKSLFSKSELKILEEVSKRFKNTNADDIIESSHNEAPWRMTEYGQEIPYEYAAHDADSAFTDEEIRFFHKIAG